MEYTDLELYIQIVDGHPQDHPILAGNFKVAFPDVNVNDLPADRFAKFIRVAPPVLRTFEVYEGVSYLWVDNVVKDVHRVRDMTEEERAAKIIEIDEMVAQVMPERFVFIDTMLEQETSESAQVAWMSSKAAHENWTFESYDPITPFPPFPIRDKDGNWKHI